MSVSNSQRVPQWISIQYLRAIAALMVVLHHVRNPEPWLFNPLSGVTFGQAGVDIFFVISGFIMYAAARDEAPGIFVYRRLVRVAPLYWCATLIAVPIFYRAFLIKLDPQLFGVLAQSLAFIPHYNLAHPTEIWPLLVPGWTLCYEMFFYLIFAVALWRGRVLPLVVAITAAVVAIGFLYRGDSAILRTYTDPIILEFTMGLLLARMVTLWRGGIAAAALLLPIGLILLPLTAEPGPWRVLQWGVPALMLVAGALALEARGALPRSRALKSLGDASYSLYLVHPIVIAIMAKVVQKLPVNGWPQFIVMIVLCTVASIVAGLIVHAGVEKPLLRALRRGGRQPVPVAG